MIDFSKIVSKTANLTIDPRSIFMGLPSRESGYEYPRDVQTEVWKQWFSIRDNKECIIKMNTGSGKTVVGLMILKSCLNESKGTAVYVVPDSFLVKQVCNEARKLGISVTDDPDDIQFLRSQSILIINIQTLVNGKSKFGMRTDNNIPIGSIIIDDVHACLASIEEQFSVSIPITDNVYAKIIEVFSEDLKLQSENKFFEITQNGSPYDSMLVPFWAWQSKCNTVYKLIAENSEADYSKFNFQLLKESFHLCNCMISSRKIEITPKCIPIRQIKSFIGAKRKIYMSATLADDSAFVSALDLNHNGVTTIIAPEKADDIGDRLIVFPQIINKNISTDEIKYKLKELSQTYNTVVIVPSYKRAEYWKDVADKTLNSTNMAEGIRLLTQNHVGLVVIINKYDGIDLPNTACRILAIDGLPTMRSLYDAFEKNATPRNKRLCGEQIQKIEQGMGRGVRSNSDYCAVCLIGRTLADIIYTSGGIDFFSDATKKQFELSEQLWDQIKGADINEIFSLFEYSLKRNENWVSLSREALDNVMYSKVPRFDENVIAIRQAFNLAENEQYKDATSVIEERKNQVCESDVTGLLKQHMAEYVNFYDSEASQQILLSAHSNNKALLKPLKGIQYEKIINRTNSQAEYFIKYITENNIGQNNYIIKLNSILEKLVFSQENTKQFEQALKDLSFMLGIFSNRPEDDYGKGPDNFWDIGDGNYLVIECKSGTITEKINKHDCNQLNGSINWFDNMYTGSEFKQYPIMIHNSDTFDYACSPNIQIRIMTPELLSSFKENIIRFSELVVLNENYTNSIEIFKLLDRFNLLGTKIVNSYTKEFRLTRE